MTEELFIIFSQTHVCSYTLELERERTQIKKKDLFLMGAACVIRLFKQFSLLEFIHFISAYFLFDWKKKLVNKLKM
jgi:hypothetical protein